MVKIDGWAAVITIWIEVTLMRVEGATSSNNVVNVVIEDGILHWELPNDPQQQVAAYHVLIYREGHRMEFPPVWVVGMSYNLNNLNLAAGTYYIEVQTILRFSDMGPYSDPIKYTVQGYTSLSLVLIAIISTLLLGLIFGSLIFVFSMWRLRQRNSLEDNGSEEGGNSPLACNSSFRSSPVTNIELNAAYGHPLGGSTTVLLPPRFEHGHNLTENEMTYEAITNMYPSSTTETTPPVYIEETEIHAPSLSSVASRRRTCESADVEANQYLEILASNSTHVTNITELTDCNAGNLDCSGQESPTVRLDKTDDSGGDYENSMQ